MHLYSEEYHSPHFFLIKTFLLEIKAKHVEPQQFVDKILHVINLGLYFSFVEAWDMRRL
jgi:hypothetical protein